MINRERTPNPKPLSPINVHQLCAPLENIIPSALAPIHALAVIIIQETSASIESGPGVGRTRGLVGG